MTEQSEAQAFLTMQLINKIGAFSDSQRGDFSYLYIHIFSHLISFLSSGDITRESFGINSLVNIKNLSVELENHVSKQFALTVFINI